MDVGVHDHAFVLLEPRAQNHVGGLAGYSREREKLVHLIGDFASEITHDLFCCADHGFRFVPEKTCRPHIRLKLFGRERGEILDGGVFLEQLGRDYVHPYIRRLG